MSGELTYYVGDLPLFKGDFSDANGDAALPTPSSASVKIVDDDEVVLLSPTAAAIDGDEVSFQVLVPAIVGVFKTYFTVTFGVGGQVKTIDIDYRVIEIDGRAS